VMRRACGLDLCTLFFSLSFLQRMLPHARPLLLRRGGARGGRACRPCAPHARPRGTPRRPAAIGRPNEVEEEASGAPPSTSASTAAFTAEAGLLLTAALWGTYAPALKLILADAATAPSPAALTAARGTLQALLLFGLAAAVRGGGGGDGQAAAAPPPPRAAAPPAATNPLGALLTTPAPSAAWAGVELGALNFGAAALHAAGLARTSATAASFIVCVTAILTPALAASTGERQSARVWAGCGVALAGAAILAADSAGGGGGGGGAPDPTALVGDAFVLAAAAFYSLTTIRLSQHAPRFDAAALAAGKSAALAAAATVFVVAAAVGAPGGLASGLSTAAGGLADPAHHTTQAALLAWTAAGPGAAAAFLQTRGQATVPPARAQTLFAAVPVFSAAFAAAFLGERLGPVGLAGGALILLGGVVAREPAT